MLDISQRLELIVDVGMWVLDIDGREVILARVVLELLHEQHSQARVRQLSSFEPSLFHTLAHLQVQCQTGLDRLDYIWVIAKQKNEIGQPFQF